jgi:hypothetical protein
VQIVTNNAGMPDMKVLLACLLQISLLMQGNFKDPLKKRRGRSNPNPEPDLHSIFTCRIKDP